MAPLLEVRNLRINFHTFEGTSRVINGVSLTIEKGEAVALVGETGCGKTVTAKAIMGILPIPPAEIIGGSILFKGEDLLETGKEGWRRIRGKEISMIFQDPMASLNPVFTVGEQLVDIVRWAGRRRAGLSRFLPKPVQRGEDKEAVERAVDMLDKVKLPSPREIMNKYPIELSGGMSQRVMIAMALITNPDLVLADEPGTALDVTIQDQIMELLKERVGKAGISVLYITHNLGVARELSQRIYVMYAGEISEVGETGEIFRNPAHPYTVGLLESIPKLTGKMAEGIRGRIPDYTNPPKGCRFHPRCKERLPICETIAPRLVQTNENHWVKCHLWSR